MRSRALIGASIAALAMFAGALGGGEARSDTGANAIQVENAKPGTPGWDDFSAVSQQDAISGFASKTSVNHGDAIDLYVTTTAPSFTIDVFRMGWYGGVGARLVQSLGSFTGVHQPIPAPDPKTGMVSCDNWTKTTTLSIPSTWVTGAYLAKLTASNGNKSWIYFVVRDDGGTEPILFQSSVTTYQAYNAWGGVSLYTNNSNKASYPYAEATKVSFDRPYDPLDSNGAGQFFAFEYPFIRWAESQGYDLSYITDVDTSTNVNPLTNHRVFMSIGHDEYWSKNMRDNVENAISRGVNAAFFSANSAYWQIRLEADAAGNPNRVEVGYKVYATDGGLPGPDPQYGVDNSVVTTRWRDAPVNRPENGLLGVMYQDQVQRDYPYVVQNASNWIYAGTGFVEGQSIPGIVGYEYDKVWNNGASPPGLTVLSNSPVVGCCEGSGNSFSNSTLYTAPSGAQVFASGTIQWSWGLDNYTAHYANAGIQRTTANILDAFSKPLAATGPAVTLTPSPLSLPSTITGSSSSRAVTLQNTGSAALTIASMSIGGTNASDFSSTSTCPTSPATLAAGASCAITVTFAPQVAGPRSATLSVVDDAPGSPQTVSLAGTGTSPNPGVQLSPASLTFPSQSVGTPSAAQSVSVQNVGGAPLAISSVSVGGAAASDYGTSTTCPAAPGTLAAGASCSVSVIFTPSTTGSRSAALNIVDNAAGSPHSVSLTGVGAAAASAGFDKNLGTKSENVGGTTMTLTTAAAASASTRVVAFLVWNSATATLSTMSGGGLTWTVDAQVKDANDDHVAIASASAPSGLASGTVLTGTFSASVTHGLIAGASFNGVASAAPVDATKTTTGGGSAAWSAGVPTTNASDLVVGFSVRDANATSTPAAPNTEIHDFGDSSYWGWATSVYQLTTAAGTATVGGTWSTTTGATANGTAAVAYKAAAATAPAPAVTLAPTSIQFGSQRTGTTSGAQSATVTNSGAAPLTISSISAGGANPGDFGRTSTCPVAPATLAAGASCVVSVTFTPTAAGSRSATLQIADDAAGSPQSLALSGTGTAPTVALTPASLDFGQQVVNTTSAGKSVLLTNSGTAPLAITSLVTALEAQGDYAFTTNCPASPATLAVGASCTITLTFTPSNTGARNAVLRITDDAGDSPQVVPLSGSGVAPAPAVSVSPSTVAFASQVVGTTSASQPVLLTNSGAAPLQISGIAIGGTNPSDFAQTNACPASVAPGAACEIDVTFTPSATGSRGATLQVSDNATGSPHSVTLTGTGGAAAPALTLAPGSIAFGAQRVGTTSAALTSTLQNTGSAPLTISSITVTGASPADFSVIDNCPRSPVQLSIGGSCTVSVAFSPSATGARTASVTIADDAPGSPQAISLSGTGTSPAVALSPSAISFGSQPVNTSSTAQPVTLTNTGTAPLSITSVSIVGTNASDFSSSTSCGAALAASASCTVAVTFKPTAAGSRSATLQIVDDAPASPHTVGLTGNGSTSTIGFDKSLGTVSQNVGGTTMKLTSSAAAVAHSRAVVIVQWSNATRTLASVTGGGLTWTIDFQAKSGTNEHLGIASADAPAGLPAGTVLTATFSGSVTLGLMAGASFTGIASTAPVDGASSSTQAGVRAWSAGVTRANTTDLVLGASTIDANTTSTATAPNIEIHDFGNSAYYGWLTTTYAITSSAGATTVNGTWAANTGATSNLTVAVAYKGA